MNIDTNMNYIVSGLERSGTSLLMQVIVNGGAPSSFDHDTRPPDNNNPRGYFELEGGKIINRLMEGNFPMEDYRGKFIKITAYGMKFLPEGRYKIVYSERNIDEILDSMEKMAKITDADREDTKRAFTKLNEMIKDLISRREDCEVLFVNYNTIMEDPETNIRQIHDFLGIDELNLERMIQSVDKKLYRNVR